MRGRGINQLLTAGLILLCSPALAQKGEPPITPVTMRSGGEIEPERAALKVEHVALDVRIDPERRFLSGVAQLTLSTRIAQTRLLIDL